MRRATWHDGWYRAAQWRASPNHGPRPAGVQPWLAIIHSISLPPGIYRGDAIERLFGNRLDGRDHPYFATLDGLRVSAHFVIRRSGRLLQFVSCDERAWHAGKSVWRAVDDCNDHSIGIELEGLEGEPFDRRQYPVLCRLLAALARRYPLREVVGHEHVAPGRKGDPGAGFDWLRLSRGLGWQRGRFAPWASDRPWDFPAVPVRDGRR